MGRARAALALLREAPTHGLDPARYDTDELANRLEAVRDPAAAAAFEQDLDRVMQRYLADLHDGRLPSQYRNGAAAAAPFDAAPLLRHAFDTGRFDDAVRAAAPAIPLYDRIRATLAQYRELARIHPAWPPLPPVPGAGTATGNAYKGAALLRERLRLLGDLDADAAAATDSDIEYPAELATGVRRFQARHGLAEDGLLGPQTVAALSVPLTQRVDQLVLTLERLRWLPPLPHGRIIAVNLPAYRLWAFATPDASAGPALEMRVIVGAAGRTPTPLFIGQMRYLEFNPYWNVPRSIEVGEIIPKLARNPAYLRQNDMEMVTPSGDVMDDAASGQLAALRAGTARVRQRPGPMNVLGAVKFAMPNPMNIYLHSTSARELFKRTRRDLSHGCIRVERPEELAEFVLGDPVKWGLGSVKAAMADGQSRTVYLPVPVPVVLFYATAVTDHQGRALFADDVYRLDAPLLRALRAR